MEHQTLPSAVNNLLNKYLMMNFGGGEFACPYFINPKWSNAGLSALVGKGLPEEIEMEMQIICHRQGLNLKKLKPVEIRQLMQSNGVGIDCSGLVVHLLNAWLYDQHNKPLISYLKFSNNSLMSRLRRWLRPVENIGANTLTSLENCDQVDIQNVRPGDMVRSKGLQKNAHHVLLITDVYRDNGIVKEIDYVQSARKYGEEHGVRTGKIIVTNQDAELKDQNWVHDTNMRNWALEELLIEYEDNGLRRLKRVNLNFQQL